MENTEWVGVDAVSMRHYVKALTMSRAFFINRFLISSTVLPNILDHPATGPGVAFPGPEFL